MKTERQSEDVALMEASAGDGGKDGGPSEAGSGGSSNSGDGNSAKPPNGKGGKSNSGSPNPPPIWLPILVGAFIYGLFSAKPSSNTNQTIPSNTNPPPTIPTEGWNPIGKTALNVSPPDTNKTSLNSTNPSSTVASSSPKELEEKNSEEIIVDFKETDLPTDEIASEFSVQQIFKRLNLDEKQITHVRTPGLKDDNVYIVRGNSELLQILRKALFKTTEFIEPNYTYQMASLFPKDPFGNLQWYLLASRPGINAPEAHRIARSIKALPGKGVIVAVLDTGGSSGKDLSPDKLVQGYGYNIAEDKNGKKTFVEVADFQDKNGHGGLLLSIIGGDTNNDYGTFSVAYEARLKPIRVLDAKGYGTVAIIADAIKQAAKNGATVINLSMTGEDESEAIKEAIAYARQKNVIIVAAAGNDGRNTASYPALYEGVLGVGAYDKDGQKAPYSAYGTGVDILAPGGVITGGQAAQSCETLPSNLQGLFPSTGITGTVPVLTLKGRQDQLCSAQGTSQAAAVASGVVAVSKGIVNQRGLNSPDLVVDIIKDAVWVPNNSTSDEEIGRLDAAKAAKFAKLLIAAPGSKQALAAHLKKIGAKLYGAKEGCPLAEAKIRDSRAQLNRLGYDFFNIVEYIDCSNDNSLCAGKNIRQYPTWEINGRLYPGSKSLIQLARLSDYGGSHNFAESIIERGDELANESKPHNAMVLYADAQKLDPNIRVADSWNKLCWFGSLNQNAAAVMKACEQAVALEPENGSYLDSRGVARALTGDKAGAIEDFQAFINLPGGRNKDKRKEWIGSLRSGKNPFTKTELENLRYE